MGGAVETSSLIVMHTHGNGPWLRARDLTLGTLVCDERASATSPLRRCPDALLDEYTKNRRAYVVWFPITGTVQTIAFLYHASE
ncbi:MAG TPA: hypothetical protein VL463_14465 [Kofleriaceae bacterium]|nr:hypothetical protein [Kofleriaceae bacterium]